MPGHRGFGGLISANLKSGESTPDFPNPGKSRDHDSGQIGIQIRENPDFFAGPEP
jgi:hypothetical protein